MLPDSKIFVAGHKGLVGSAIFRELQKAGFRNLLTRDRHQVDLLDTRAVDAFFTSEKPEYVFLAAAKVGGIRANDTFAADFIHQNLQIQNNVIHSAHTHGVTKLLFLGSSCIYPKFPRIPIPESELLNGPLEPTNQWYALAKIAGLKMCEAYRKQHGRNFISAMPTNIYGPNDNYDLENSHVLPAFIRRFHEAKSSGTPGITLWGTGSACREFLHSEDLARACIHLMLHYNEAEHVNVGCGSDLSIRDLASLVASCLGYTGAIHWDPSKPDGTPKKLLDCSRLFALGWKPQITLREGILLAYADFLKRFGP
ncbi:MAG: GDP-L-fucose synthase [Verrucomicrobiae bacterium]|nr:GDP-L-fucose synthase [Verrucomicrobiae bacterium]